MAKLQLALTPHPHYPDAWLDYHTAANMLYQAGLPTHLNKTPCKRDGLEVSDTVHIRRLSLEQYIKREQFNNETSIVLSSRTFVSCSPTTQQRHLLLCAKSQMRKEVISW